MTDGFHFDPYTILGLGRTPSPQEIREAYRQKSKKHHPDHGGDEWAFMIVVRAYELLGGRRDVVAEPAEPTPRTARAAGATIHPASKQDTGQVRQGVHDQGLAPSHIAAVEIVWMRYEVEDVTELLSLPGADRNLSGSIHVIWPDPEQPAQNLSKAETEALLREIQGAFESLKTKTKFQASHLSNEDGQFEGWISYPSGSVAWEAFRTLHISLKLRGLGVRQWTRDLSIPRDSHSRRSHS